jgi:hypothetical protein
MENITNDDTRDVAIRIVDELVSLGIMPDCLDTEYSLEFDVQDIIHNHINALLNIQSI